MGCFSGTVETRGTKMFARLDGVGNQYVVYTVEYSSPTDTAVIFPLPIAAGDASVQFVSLDGYADFFRDLASGFVAPSAGRWMQDRSESADDLRIRSNEMLYVPSIEELGRLDQSLRPAADFWDKLPNYRDFGFVVVKLPSTVVELVSNAAMSMSPAWDTTFSAEPELAPRGGCAVLERVRLCPIAFRFASREPRCVYFPTTMILDGEFRPVVEFDHTLYLQHDKLGNDFVQHHVGHVSLRASNFMRDDAGGIVCPRSCCFRRIIRGQVANQDLWVYPSNAGPRIARWQRKRDQA